MQKAGVMPNSVTFVCVLSASAGLAILEAGKQVHALILIVGLVLNAFVSSALLDMYTKCKCLEDAQKVFDRMLERNVVSWNTMIDGYAKYGDISKARKLFDEMPERSVASWTAMMAGYAQLEHADEAFELFRRLQYGCIKPDQFTYACVLSICASLVVLEQGKQVHARSIRSGFEPYVSVGNGLLTMYSKCGSIEDAHKMFRRMPEHTLVSWTAMISGCAMHGLADDALQLFGQMQQAGVKPDTIAFLGILSACSHAGLLNLGCYYFDSMSREHGLIPRTDHYACMIDLFGRAGQLDVAKNIINSMPFEPDARIWAALLGACRINDNAELGIHAAKHLFELEPQNCATYILLSNIYAAAGSWDDVAKVRRMMKEKGIKKMPGWSWIEVKNKVHTFLVGDRSHPQMEQQTD
jgi:pentatricopeptide repeat protein